MSIENMMADDMSIEKLKIDMDDSIWNNPKIFSTEKPWYYYVNAFKVSDSDGDSAEIKTICEVNGQITILNCETGLGKLGKVKRQEMTAKLVRKLIPDAPGGVEIQDIQTAWNAMVQRLSLLENYVAEPNHPSWWNPNQMDDLPARA